MPMSFDAMPQSLTEIINRLSAIEEKLEKNLKPTNNDLISVATACKYLNVCKATFYKLINTTSIETVKVGRRRLVKMESLKSIK